MGLLTPEQVEDLRSYLEGHGLTFESLQSEMLDHICCDVEMYLSEGMSFEDAMKEVKSKIPKNQFKKIQIETMEALNKKTSFVNILKYGSLTLLLLSVLFKVLHFPGANTMLLTAFIGLIVTFFTAVFTSPLIRQKDNGQAAILVLIISISLFLTSICFQLLHLPGTNLLRSISVLSLIVILSVYAIFCYLQPQKAHRHLIFDMIRKEGLKTERILFILFAIGCALKFLHVNFLFNLVMVLLLTCSAIFYMINSWKYYLNEKSKSNNKLMLLMVSIAAFSMFMLPTLGGAINGQYRNIMVWSSISLVALIIAFYYLAESQDKYKQLLSFFSFLTAGLGIANLFSTLNLMNSASADFLQSLIYNPITMASFAVLVIIFFQKPTFRTLIIFTLAMLFFSYQGPGF